MARKGTVFLGFATLLLFGVLSLILTNSELVAIDPWRNDEPSHSQIVGQWRREDRDLLGARQHNLPAEDAPAAAVGLNVGRVLAKYDREEERELGGPRDSAAMAASESPAIGRARREFPQVGDRVSYERQLAQQLNWTARLISSSSHLGDVQERLETLGRLKRAELRLDTSTRELWLYLRDQLRNINFTEAAKAPESVKDRVLHSVKEQLDLLSRHTSDVRSVIDSYVNEGWREKLSVEMTQLMQKRLHHLQNPERCDEAKKLLCRISKPCGFGCQMHHVAYCFIFAYATERVLVLDSSSWRYSGQWETVFQPLSKSPECSQGVTMSEPWSSYANLQPPKVILAPPIESLGASKPIFLPMAVPTDIVERLKAFHGYPFVWFIGQFLQYLMRPSDQLTQYLEDRRKHLNISHPVVGVHIRRTDKLQQEASYHSVEEYMTQVEEWYDRRKTLFGKEEERRVFLATDDKSVLSQATELYPHYKFSSDNKVSQTAGQMRSRYSEAGLYGVVLDVILLSECDYIVCTLSSQVIFQGGPRLVHPAPAFEVQGGFCIYPQGRGK
jgi:hypothetical protein